MRLRSQIANWVLPGFVLAAAGLVQSGCTHGPRHTFTTMWDRGRSVGQATARLMPLGNRGNKPIEASEAVAEAATPAVPPQPTRTVVFHVENDPFLADSLQTANAAPRLPDGAGGTTPRPGNPFASISSRDTDSRVMRLVPDANQPLPADSAAEPVQGEAAGERDSQFASGFDTQLDRLRRSIRRDLNSASRQNADQPDERVTRSRVNALLEQARQQSAQGDVTAARESAAEAEQIASNTGLFFGPDDIRPSDILRELDSRPETQPGSAAAERDELANLWDTPASDNAAAGEDEELFPMLNPELPETTGTADGAGAKIGTTGTNGPLPELPFRPASDFLPGSAAAESDSFPSGEQAARGIAPTSNNVRSEAPAAANPHGKPAPEFVWQAEDGDSSRSAVDDSTSPSVSTAEPSADLPMLPMASEAGSEDSAVPSLRLPDTPRSAANLGTQVASSAGAGVSDRFGWQTIESRKRPQSASATPPAHLGWAPVDPQPAAREVKPASVRPRSRAMQRLTANLRENGPALQAPATADVTSGDSVSVEAVAVAESAGTAAPEVSSTGTQSGMPVQLTFPDQDQAFAPSVPESGSEAVVLDGEPLPEIFNTEPVDATVAVRPPAEDESGSKRRKSVLPSKLVISVLLGLVAVALAWHRFRRMRIGMRPVR